jgi:tRNA1Val (adenine37-N6)-methyltransferase
VTPAVTGVTTDALFRGRVSLRQPARSVGYRVNVDALLLAAFAARVARRARTAVDLGAGTGAVGLTLLHLGVVDRVVLVEIDPEAARLARQNLDDNAWSERGEVLCADVARLPRALSGDLVVCNPPYVAPGRGRRPRIDERARARQGGLGAFVRAARAVQGRRVRACFVYPAPELATLLCTLRESGLEPKRLRAVHATARSRARVVLVEACAGKAGGLEVEAPLVEREGSGYSAELRALLG